MVFGKQSLGTSPGGLPDDGIAIRRCVSWAITIARLTKESNLVIFHSRSAGCGTGSWYTRYLCTNRLPDSWNNRTSTAIPEIFGLSACSQNLRVTVHAGNDVDTFSKSSVTESLFIIEMISALSDVTFPHCTPLDRAAPELAQAEMATHHMRLQ